MSEREQDGEVRTQRNVTRETHLSILGRTRIHSDDPGILVVFRDELVYASWKTRNVV